MQQIKKRVASGVILIIFWWLSSITSILASTYGSGNYGAGIYSPTASISSLAQYKADGTTTISAGGWTNETSVTIKFTMTSVNGTDSLTPQVEIRDNGTALNGTVTNSGTPVAFSGTPVTGIVTVTGLTSGITYHWKARAANSDGTSNWVTKGGSPDLGVDTTAPTPPGTPMPTPASPTNQTSQTWTWNAAVDSISGVLQYAWRTTGSAITSGTSTITSAVTSLAEGIYNFFVKAVDNAGNESAESQGSLTVDTTNPDVTINQAIAQADPTNNSSVNFTVVFTETVTDFATGDVTLSGTAGATTATVTGSGTTYNVAVTGMTGTGTVIASIASGVAHDAAGNENDVSTSSDNTVTYNITGPVLTAIVITDTSGYTNDATPTISITQTGTPTHAAFSCNGGTNWSSWIAYADTISTFDITNGATGCNAIDGTKTITAKLKDTLGNESGTTNDSTVYDVTGPTGSITNTTNPTNDTTPSLDLTMADVGVGITGGQMRFSCDNATWTDWETFTTPKTNFNVKPGSTAFGCSTNDGAKTVYVQFRDSLLNIGTAYNTGAFTLDTTGPAWTSMTITDTSGYTNDTTPAIALVSSGTPTHAAFSCNGGTDWSSWIVYADTISSFDMTLTTGCSTTDGTKTISGKLKDALGNESTTTSDSTIYDTTAPTSGSVSYTNGYYTTTSVALAASDGTDSASGINTGSRITQRRSATLASDTCGTYGSWGAIAPTGTYPNFTDATVVTNNCYQYRYLVSDNLSNQATYTGANTAKIDTGAPTVPGTPLPTPASPTNQTSQTWTWTAAVDSISGVLQYAWRTTGTAVTSGTTAVTSVVTNLAEGVYNFFVKAVDNAGNESSESQGSLTVDTTKPNVTINQASGQVDPTNNSPVNFTVVFSESVTDFATGDVTLSGTAGATTATVTGSGTTYNVAATGMTGTGTVIAAIASGVAHDAAGNENNVSTSTDNTITYSIDPPLLTSITISDTSGYTLDTTPTITTVSSGSPTHIAFSCNNGTNWSTWMVYADTISNFDITTGATGCTTGDGTKIITAKLKDQFATESGWAMDTTVYDTTDPTGSITQTTNPIADSTPTLTLTLVDAGAGTTGAQMRFSCNNSNWTTWESYATSKNDLDIKPATTTYGCGTTDGARTIYVQFRDSLLNTSSVYDSGTFVLDTTAPSIPGAPTTTATAADNTPSWSWIASTDSGSGLDMYQIQWSQDENFGSGVESTTTAPNSFTHSSALADGTWHVRVRARDTAGNYSNYSDRGTITIETITPTPSATPASSANNTSNSSSSNSSGGGGGCHDTATTTAPDLFEIRTTNTTATLYFAPPNMPYSSFYVAFSRKPDSWEYGTEYNQGFSGGVLRYTAYLLSPNTKYYFAVRAGNGCASGPWSKTMMVQTTNSAKITKVFYKNIIVAVTSRARNIFTPQPKLISPIPETIPPTINPSTVTISPNPTYAPPVNQRPSIEVTPTPKKRCILFWCF